eukprot:CAMPEP_0178421446 /NCGR_PEP_ID=MMETSP0689_2-20121128/26650_1 /TAXON_ID=160604 /ORGANISM="Amphidinium massartii, Strain CS-259" /LENGTH=481 /DNA_ID=CAMNT_0020042955 /DNA_START=53 /DNA_END=1494 /DNA_ORIENTATION=-
MYNKSYDWNQSDSGNAGYNDDWRDSQDNWSSGWNNRRGNRKGKGRGRGGGGGKGRGRQWEDPPETAGGFDATTFLGEWEDSLGNTVTVTRGPERRSGLIAKLERNGKINQLSVRRDLDLQTWICGNAILEVESSKANCVVWHAYDGRRSVWRRTGEDEAVQASTDEAGEAGGEASSSSTASLLPWLLRPSAEGKRPPEIEVSEASRDGARANAVLDIRQVLGNNRSAQNILSSLLMDHDLLGEEHEDCIVPCPESPLWERLPEQVRRNAIHRVAAFYATGGDEEVLIEAAQVPGETYVGRHRFLAPPRDLAELRRRWIGRTDEVTFTKTAAHVLTLYQALENPLATEGQRSILQLAVDEQQIRHGCIEYELFASPMNAQVGNGKFGSRWPHVERLFGSAGAYPGVLEKFPENAVVGVHPPATEGYLEHVMVQSLDKMLARFKTVHLYVPVREAAWRPMLKRLKGASFTQNFWDSTAGLSRA